ncbi:hypothetical protein [Paenibacillus senegalensis]|nr:hypothetical protein [Paenibacillus senegalensis]
MMVQRRLLDLTEGIRAALFWRIRRRSITFLPGMLGSEPLPRMYGR